jgi:hypothetical protein
LGIQVKSTEDVLAAKKRLQKEGLATFDEMNTTCCYARQDKIWDTGPDGHRLEVFTVLADADEKSIKSPNYCTLYEPKQTETYCSCS